MEPDFSGYVTKAGVECSDGLTIMPEAFKHQDRVKVPLVWHHMHNGPENVLGHAILEARKDGIYGYGYFNKTEKGQASKALVEHDDVKSLSIYANKLKKVGNKVMHGFIREVSLVLAGANPEAFIDYVAVQHGDDFETLDDEAVYSSMLALEHGALETEEDEEEEKVEHADGDGETVQDIVDSMNEKQKNVMYFFIGEALSGNVQHSDDEEDDLEHKEGSEEMPRNVFEQNKSTKTSAPSHELTHDEFMSIVSTAKDRGTSLKHAFEDFALAHGIEDIDILFPDAKSLDTTPQFDKRRTEWVSVVLNGIKKSPVSRVKTLSADLKQEDARAKGYIKGNYKKEEWIKVSKRTTGPTTIYKKQKLDRDDTIDITDFDVIAWLKGEMRLMLDEEIARAILIGDGRDPEDEDHIADPSGSPEGNGIRSILNDHELYVAKVYVGLGADGAVPTDAIDRLLEQRKLFKGTGTPDFFTTESFLTSLLLMRDTMGHRLYKTVADVAAELRVGNIVSVEPMEEVPDLVGIMINLQDYTAGADRGGDVTLFDDFDIDYNQMKYLLETRLSGSVTKIRSAVVIMNSGDDTLVETVNAPTFVPSTGVVTIVATTGIVYKNEDTGATLSTGAQTALAEGATLNVVATPASGYFLVNNVEYRWAFKRPLS